MEEKKKVRKGSLEKNVNNDKKDIEKKNEKSNQIEVNKKNSKDKNSNKDTKSSNDNSNKNSNNNSNKNSNKNSNNNNNKKETVNKKVRRKKSIFYYLIQLVLIAIMVYCGIKIFNWNKDNISNNNITKELSSAIVNDDSNTNSDVTAAEKLTVDFEKLKNINPDTVAWININSLSIGYPVVKSSDNNFYLKRSFDKTYNEAGWIFADYRNKFDGTDKNIIVYGHNRLNDSMFGTLDNLLESGWEQTEDNTEIIFNTPNEKAIYKIFSVYKIEAEDYYITTAFSGNEFDSFIKTIKSRSIRNFGVNVDSNTKVLTLSTCADNDKYRIVVHAAKM